MKKILILIILILVGITAVSAHGVDVTADTMVITNDTNGQFVKDLADANGINISVYKFTSQDEVEHILEHSVNNTNKRILLVAYQDSGNEFLKNHPDISNRIIVVNDVNNDSVVQGLNNIINAQTQPTQSGSNFGLPLAMGIVIGLIIGLGVGVLIMKKRS